MAKSLLDSGKLNKRVTIIPLNKIVPKAVLPEKIKAAKEIDRQSQVAISLVGFEASLEAAMQYIFGGTFICEGTAGRDDPKPTLHSPLLCVCPFYGAFVDKQLASMITFDKRIQTRTVTLQGDVYDPSGTMTGGSTSKSGSILAKLASYKQVRAEHDRLMEKLRALDQQIEASSKHARDVKGMHNQLELKQHELATMQRQLDTNPMGKLLNRHASLKQSLNALERDLEALKKQKHAIDGRVREAESDWKDLMHGDRAGKLKELAKNLKSKHQQLSKETASLAALQKASLSLEAELGLLSKNQEAGEHNLHALVQGIDLLIKEIEEGDGRLAGALASANQATDMFEAESKYLRHYDQQVSTLEDRRLVIQAQAEQLTVQRRQLGDELTRHQQEGDQLTGHLQGLIKDNPWIKKEQEQFGQPDGAFHFSPALVNEAKRKARVLGEQFHHLRRTINVDVMEMIDRVESKEAALRQMINTVKKDRVKIVDTIDKLNGYKLETLTQTWQRVNEDFGAIFAELLPPAGANWCKLEPPEGQSLTDGLDIKVCLGSVWKASLSELSGGQRSVVALSLILAMLQFKPAPMYILDEVDAALDASHTQNIGKLLKTRFKGSQFIVVSLKEGMFTNANVLFRTSFKDGVSVVERIEQQQQEGSGTVNPTSKGTAAKGAKQTRHPAAAITA